MKSTSFETDDIDVAVNHLTSLMQAYRIFLFKGDLGAGKTFLVQRWMEHIKVLDQVTSPTFSLINIYESEQHKIYHMDMYRLKTIEEALNLGLMEYLDDQNAIILIEWPELVMQVIDYPYVGVNISADSEMRSYLIEST